MKIKSGAMKKIQGSISVLLVIILLPMLTFSALIVDIGRVKMAEQMMASASDLAMNTALANYDTILKDVYGLFAMSQAEGMSNEELGEELNKYFAKTLSSYGVVPKENSDSYVDKLIGDFSEILVNGKVETNDFLKLNEIDLDAAKVEGSSLANAGILRKQIVEYMKYRAPLGVGLSFLDSLTAFEKMDDQNKVVKAQVKTQESTQDVTKACQTLIELIRAYDKRVEELNKDLTGVTNSTDGKEIPLEDYDTHPMKYLSEWDQNYTHINKLNLVFLANTPDTSTGYLYAIKSTNDSLRYVSRTGKIYNELTHGINISVPPANDLAAARVAFYEQVSKLTADGSKYLAYTDKYKTPILKSNLLKYNSNNLNHTTFADKKEDEAIAQFIAFENFWLNKNVDGKINYSEMKDLLEQIYRLDKYRADYDAKLAAEITKAETELQEAKNKLTALQKQRDNAAGAMNGSISSINTATREYIDKYKDMAAAVSCLSILGSDKQNEIKNLLGTLPAKSDKVSFRQYYNTNIAKGDWDKYAEAFKSLINSALTSKGTPVQKAIIAEAKNFVNAYGYNGKNFEKYLQGKFAELKDANNYLNNDLFKLLCCLKTCHDLAATYAGNIESYESALAAIPEAQKKVTAAEKKVDTLKEEREDIPRDSAACAQKFYTTISNYQSDLYYYDFYINAAKNTLKPEIEAISTHFGKLLANLNELRTDLDEIEAQVVNVKTAIKTYEENLEKWEDQNKTYETTHDGSDSFSIQTKEDIEKAKTEYNTDLYETLQLFVIAIWNEYDELLKVLENEANFVYGTERIDKITTVENLKQAISKTSFSDVVTVEEATEKLKTLYKAVQPEEYVPYTYSQPDEESTSQPNGELTTTTQLGFLTPRVLPIQALKFLNSAYPEKDENVTAEQQTSWDENDQVKNQLTGNVTEAPKGDGSEQVDENVKGDFGYTYQGKDKKASSDLPSKSNKDEEYKAKEYQMTVSNADTLDENVNASDGFDEQSNARNDVLGDIGKTANTALENLYILNYIFENFSYNTIVQEQVNKDSPLKSKSILGMMAEADANFADGEKVGSAKQKTVTLSNYPIDASHNNFYGAEVEYILFGNKTAKTNVAYAKGSIYAIRFGFNCIFVFTDSEIRNTTMAAGLAVQAATFGFVPYQVVQIVLQLALAAAESAIDLAAMDRGLSVAIVKTRDTWSLSLSGAKNALKDVGNAAAQMVTNKVVGGVTKAVNTVTSGLNDMLDAGAEELGDAIQSVSNNLESTAAGVLESVADEVFASVMSDIESAINALVYMDKGRDDKKYDNMPTLEELRQQTEAAFNDIEAGIERTIKDACGGNAMALSASTVLSSAVGNLVKNMKESTINAINDVKAMAVDDVDVTGALAKKLNDLKLKMIAEGETAINRTFGQLEAAAQKAVTETKDTLQDYIDKCGDELTEEAAKLIKEEVSKVTDKFVNTTLKVNGTNTSTNVKSSVASMFRFGYKDYLMLITYISICAGDSVLLRTGDMIQMNMRMDAYGHTAKDTFALANAYTYIAVSGSAELDMFFMDMSLFAETVAPDGAAGAADVDTKDGKTVINYVGMLGY